MAFEQITESSSNYQDIEKMAVPAMLEAINHEDEKIAHAVNIAIPQISALVDIIISKLNNGGRLFYIGAGTSGRLGILDASECVPTFGVSANLVTGVIAGGEEAIKSAVEFAEDNTSKGWEDLVSNQIGANDVVIGISASGSTPYVLNALRKAHENAVVTGSVVCNPGAPISLISDYPIEIIVGPEFITGSTRMKSGTAQKMVLNMISTAVMVKLGHVKGNKMIHMQLNNEKLINRAVNILMETLQINDFEQAKQLLLSAGSLNEAFKKNDL